MSCICHDFVKLKAIRLFLCDNLNGFINSVGELFEMPWQQSAACWSRVRGCWGAASLPGKARRLITALVKLPPERTNIVVVRVPGSRQSTLESASLDLFSWQIIFVQTHSDVDNNDNVWTQAIVWHSGNFNISFVFQLKWDLSTCMFEISWIIRVEWWPWILLCCVL